MSDHKKDDPKFAAQLWIGNAIAAQATRNDDDGEMISASIANAHATLYLAEQQRIANLIALWTANESDTEMLMRAGVNFGGVLDQIREGLGLA